MFFAMAIGAVGIVVAAFGLGALLFLFFSYITHSKGIFGVEFTDTYAINNGGLFFVSSIITLLGSGAAIFGIIVLTCIVWSLSAMIWRELNNNHEPIESGQDVPNNDVAINMGNIQSDANVSLSESESESVPLEKN